VFQLLKNPSYDFMRWGKPLLAISAVLMLVSIVVMATMGLNKGIEFTGGTELQIKYRERPDVGEVRDQLQAAGIASPVVTTIGSAEENEIYIRLGTDAGPGDPDELTSLVTRTLRGEAGTGGRLDLNTADRSIIEKTMMGAPGTSPEQANALAAAIADARKDVAIFHSLDELRPLAGMTPEIMTFLESEAVIGPVAVRSESYIGPAIGEELMQKTQAAILLSLVMMLIYIWIRFQLQWGFAAVAALTHDTVIVLGLFSLFQKELTLPVVAAFLTLVGYSVNDTVVIFDRIRENLKNRTGVTLSETINLAINQTLGRTIITSGLTWVVVFGLYLFGGVALNPFAFVLSAGVVVGTYSSVFIASPILVLWSQFIKRRLDARASAGPPAAGRAKKVPTPSV